MRLWHDDVRTPPAGWVWVQNNIDAREILKNCYVEEISMDHDLGATPSDGLYAAGAAEDNGLVLANWMVENFHVPSVITIHSWNPVGALRMAQVFRDVGYMVTVRPYQISQSRA